MDNYVLKSATVSRLLSKTALTDADLVKATLEDASASMTKEVLEYSIDKRTVAVGGSEEIWLNDLFSQMEDSWWSLILQTYTYSDMLLSVRQPKNILCITPKIGFVFCSWAKGRDVEVTFMNSQGLHFYENHLAPVTEDFRLNDYYAVDYQDVVYNTSELGKYDYIYAAAWDIVSDVQMQDACVQLLSPGGILVVSASNNGTKLYRDSYHSHPYTAFHRNLMDKSGYTYHVPAHYGFTVFVKN